MVIESRGRPKAALVSVDDLRRVEGSGPARISSAQRQLALSQADRVRRALKGLVLTDSVEELRRLRAKRARGVR